MVRDFHRNWKSSEDFRCERNFPGNHQTLIRVHFYVFYFEAKVKNSPSIFPRFRFELKGEIGKKKLEGFPRVNFRWKIKPCYLPTPKFSPTFFNDTAIYLLNSILFSDEKSICDTWNISTKICNSFSRGKFSRKIFLLF